MTQWKLIRANPLQRKQDQNMKPSQIAEYVDMITICEMKLAMHMNDLVDLK